MIFSTDRCPLCVKPLRMDVVEVTSGKVHIRYYCETTEHARDDTNSVTVSKPHYDHDCFPQGSLACMIFQPYVIFHSQSNNMTSVYENACFMQSSRKLIFRTKLLDLDWSQPHAVLDKLKLLVTFS